MVLLARKCLANRKMFNANHRQNTTTQKHKNTQTHKHTHTYIYTHTHTPTHPHMRTHAHTHTRGEDMLQTENPVIDVGECLQYMKRMPSTVDDASLAWVFVPGFRCFLRRTPPTAKPFEGTRTLLSPSPFAPSRPSCFHFGKRGWTVCCRATQSSPRTKTWHQLECLRAMVHANTQT